MIGHFWSIYESTHLGEFLGSYWLYVKFELSIQVTNMLKDPKVNCVFCNKSLYDHSNFESRECLSKHLLVQKILQSAIGEDGENLHFS
jgi:hypothetical protein